MMESELIVFWRLKSGVRCFVVEQPGTRRWQLRVFRASDQPLLVENFSDSVELFARARDLRPVFAARYPHRCFSLSPGRVARNVTRP